MSHNGDTAQRRATRSARAHVISRALAGLYVDLAEALGDRVELCHWTSIPAPPRYVRGDVVLVDLLQVPSTVSMQAIDGLARQSRVLLIAAQGLVSAEWLVPPRPRDVGFVYCERRGGTTLYSAAAAALQHAIGISDPNTLVAKILTLCPRLSPAEALIGTVCRDAWGIRFPNQLSARSGVSRTQVLDLVRALGFRRQEHFLTAVRFLLCHVQRVEFGRSRREAWLFAGIEDASSFRRQLARARVGSPAGFRLLANLGPQHQQDA